MVRQVNEEPEMFCTSSAAAHDLRLSAAADASFTVNNSIKLDTELEPHAPFQDR